jgi:hypothetical protein
VLGRYSRSSAAAALACAAFIIGGCGAASNGDTRAQNSSTVAEELIGQVAPPPNTQSVKPGQPVPASLRQPEEPPSASEADAHRFWISTARPERIMAFLRAHAPPGAREYGSGSTAANGQDNYWWMNLRVTYQRGYVAWLEIAIAPAEARYVVRVDAVVAAVSKRPADTLVPLVATRLTLSVVRRDRVALQTVEIGRRREVAAVARAVNALPISRSRGPVASCPIGSGSVHVLMIFRAQSSNQLLAETEVVDPYECRRPSVWISVPPRQPIGLDHARELLRNVQQLTQVHLADIPQ